MKALAIRLRRNRQARTFETGANKDHDWVRRVAELNSQPAGLNPLSSTVGFGQYGEIVV